ncbi:MAG: hypothetical protein JW759_04250 [Candidatus Coatesbacteria bacterium]|nr:hypothetical protein [Candidatus Coatesbacteria bacterium]
MRIQGTDGIRRRTAPDDSPTVRGMSPPDALLKAGVITPRFMELYGYSFVIDLVRSSCGSSASCQGEIGLNRLGLGEPVVVGWDPRDPEGQFTGALIRGIRKAGASVFSVGVVPTPAVPAYMLHIGAAGGAMITASHNLKDQNGVKLFWANQGLKYLPDDDERLTGVVLELASSTNLEGLDTTGILEDHHDAASRLFEEFMLDPANSWLEPTENAAQRLRFDRVELVVDAANGSLSKFAGKLFRKWGIGSVHEVNTSDAGDVNEGGGVAALEGASVITRGDVFADGHGAGSPLSEHRAVHEMFRLADELRKELAAGDRLLVAAVFDADGDRFFRLDYAPGQDALIVSSGDEAAFLQAWHLVKKRQRDDRPRIVHTVESDINVGAFANRSLGVCPVITAVGDKWVLYEAFASLLEGRLALLDEELTRRGREQAATELASAWKALEALSSHRPSGSQQYFALQREIDSIQKKHCNPTQVAAMEESLLKPGAIPYLIGFEEAGHSITPAILGTFKSQLPTAKSQLPTEKRLFFAGNGLKAAINTLVVTQSILQSMGVRAFHKMMASPFPRGVKRTFYAYYTCKEEFAFGKEYWRQFAEWLEGQCTARFAADFDVKRAEFAEEKDMIFISLAPKGGSTTAASIFVRNSGTEEKTGVNLRGPKELAEPLSAIGDLARRRLQTSLKSHESDYATAEALLLVEMMRQEAGGGALSVGDAIRRLADRHPSVVPERLLLEMFKQEFIVLESLTDPNAPLRLTDLGRWYIG